jgi:formate hydrogenlyase subunit 6/NADH:ubiquinone oxidoreductase subunit I
MFCGLCTEACPTKGLVMSKHFELASLSREEMVFEMEKIEELGGQFPEAPEKTATGENGVEKKTESGGDA